MADATFTAVDLSRLPAPAVVETLDYETILGELIAAFQLLKPDFQALESDPVTKILQIVAYREIMLRQRFNEAARAVMPAYAVGSDLDNLTALLGISRKTLTEADPVTGAAAVMESDNDFRRRMVLTPEGFSVAGPEGAYISHAINADADVLDASATSPNPGEVVVTVLSRIGNGAASPELVATVNAAVNADDVRPLTDHVTVQSATIINYAVEAEIRTFTGPDGSLVLAESLRRLTDYVDGSHRLGRDITLSGIYAALHSEGVQNVTLISPTADLILDRTEASWCTAIDVTHVGTGE